MRITLAQIAKLVKGELEGNKDQIITGFSGIQEAKKGDITFIEDPKLLPLINKTKASAIIAAPKIRISGLAVIRCQKPSLSFSSLISKCSDTSSYHPKGIHEAAIVDKKAKIGKNISLGPGVVIEAEASIGDNSIIYAGSYIGYKAKIGKNVLIFPNVTIYHGTQIENNVRIHSGVVIGSDGFGYTQVGGKHQKQPQIGTVLIKDDVEIGANTTIDRARFNKTIIGKGSKIDNLVQIAHNVIMGENCIIISQVGISGSVNIGKGAILAGQVGTVGHISIGEGVVAAARSVLTKSTPSFTKVIGFPAREFDEGQKIIAAQARIPEYIKKVNKLIRQVQLLESKLKRK